MEIAKDGESAHFHRMTTASTLTFLSGANISCRRSLEAQLPKSGALRIKISCQYPYREEAISQLAEQPFDAANFPYSFLEAFGNMETTIKRMRAGATNKSDLGGVLQAGSGRSGKVDASETEPSR